MRIIALALAALIGVAALPGAASAQTAATCSAQIVKSPTATSRDVALVVTKGDRETVFSHVDFADINETGTWLRIWTGGAMIDFGGCDGLDAAFNVIESFIRQYNSFNFT